MTLLHKPEHRIKNAHEEGAVAHLTFENEAGRDKFLADNRRQIKSVFERQTVDFEPILTITAK